MIKLIKKLDEKIKEHKLLEKTLIPDDPEPILELYAGLIPLSFIFKQFILRKKTNILTFIRNSLTRFMVTLYKLGVYKPISTFELEGYDTYRYTQCLITGKIIKKTCLITGLETIYKKR